MPTHEHFLSAIREAPDDDGPRLVYADWLDEHGGPDGQARAEYIRVACQIARIEQHDLPAFRAIMPSNAVSDAQLARYDDKSWNALNDREIELFEQHGKKWLQPVQDIVFAHMFRRGFVEQATVGVKKYLQHVETLFSRTPVYHLKVINLKRTKPPTPVSRVLAFPCLKSLPWLDLTNAGLSPGEVGEICDSPHLTSLTGLILRENPFGMEGVAELARLPRIRQLTFLDLSWCSLNLLALRELFKLPLDSLTDLHLSNTRLGPRGVGELAKWPGLERIRSLDLRYCGLDHEAWQVLADCPGLKRLRWLEVEGNKIDRRSKAWKALVARFGKAVQTGES